MLYNSELSIERRRALLLTSEKIFYTHSYPLSRTPSRALSHSLSPIYQGKMAPFRLSLFLLSVLSFSTFSFSYPRERRPFLDLKCRPRSFVTLSPMCQRYLRARTTASFTPAPTPSIHDFPHSSTTKHASTLTFSTKHSPTYTPSTKHASASTPSITTSFFTSTYSSSTTQARISRTFISNDTIAQIHTLQKHSTKLSKLASSLISISASISTLYAGLVLYFKTRRGWSMRRAASIGLLGPKASGTVDAVSLPTLKREAVVSTI